MLEYVPGTKINDIVALQKMEGVDLATLSERLTTSYLEQLCRHGFFHCDPHPGNVAVDAGYPGGRIIYYDFGMMEVHIATACLICPTGNTSSTLLYHFVGINQ